MAKWNVSSIDVHDVDGLKNVIVKAVFEVFEHDLGRNGYVNGEVALLPPSAATFTELGFVQLEQAISWVKEALGDEAVTNYEALVKKIVEDQPIPAPPVVLPWAPKSELPVPKRGAE
jgi:hypothetical protein